MSDKFKEVDLIEVVNNLKHDGYTIVKKFITPTILTNINNVLLDNFDYNSAKKYVGFKMGNLAIHECYLHQIIYDELYHLISFLKNEFNYSYITAGGNLNLPNSKNQKFHFDNLESNLTINIPLVDVTQENGPLSIVGTPTSKKITTVMFFKDKLYKKKNI